MQRWKRPPLLWSGHGGWLVLLLWAPFSWAATVAVPGDAGLCNASIASASAGSQLPAGLMTAISFVESGRPDPLTGRVAAWPWTANIAGKGFFYASKPEAIAAVQAAQSAGVQSIDVGCMQINLRAHPQAFANLDDAFDPLLNARYARTFLLQLYHASGDLRATIEAYHSLNAAIGEPYGQKVASIWPLYAAYVGSGPRARGVASMPRDAEDGHGVDPDHVLTPEFRLQLVKAAEFRRARDAALLGGSLSVRPALAMATMPLPSRQARMSTAATCHPVATCSRPVR